MHSCPVKHSPYRRTTRRAFAANREQVTQPSSDGRSFEGTNRRARSVMPDQWLRVYNAMHTPVSTEANSTPTTANPARTEDIPTGRVPESACVIANTEGVATEPCSRPKGQSVVKGEWFRAYRRQSSPRSST